MFINKISVFQKYISKMHRSMPLSFFVLFIFTTLPYSISIRNAEIHLPEDGILNTYKSLYHSAFVERHLYYMVKFRLETALAVICPSNQDPTLIEMMHNFVEDFKSSTIKHIIGMQGIKNGNDMDAAVTSNLVLVLRMTSRYVKYGDAIIKYTTSAKDKFGNLVCSNYTSGIYYRWPSDVEHDIAITTFLLTYKMHDIFWTPMRYLDELSSDSITPAEIPESLTYEISQAAANSLDYVVALDWINYAIHQCYSEMCTDTRKNFLYTRKYEIITEHNRDIQNYPEYDFRFYDDMVSVDEANTDAELDWLRRKEIEFHYYYGVPSPDFLSTNTAGLCSGFHFQSETVKAQLKCYMNTWKHPWFRINPLRVEVLSKSPEINQFHDILGEQLINYLLENINSAESYLSSVGDDTNKGADEKFIKTLSSRSSVTSWFGDWKLQKLAWLASLVTGLHATHWNPLMSEPYQSVEYVVGRHYKAHTDTGSPDDLAEADLRAGLRSATLLFYLNDVVKGGDTVFGETGVVASPIKGSAVFWRNLWKNGTVRNVWHAACPVLQGKKIVLNKWFRANIQLFNDPCSKEQFE